jgi:hypothetical protein
MSYRGTYQNDMYRIGGRSGNLIYMLGVDSVSALVIRKEYNKKKEPTFVGSISAPRCMNLFWSIL